MAQRIRLTDANADKPIAWFAGKLKWDEDALDKAEYRIRDADVLGFALRIRDGGKRTWIAQYRLSGKPQTETLGPVGVLKADEAREAARTKLAQVALGNDPRQAKRDAKDAAGNTLGIRVEQYISVLTRTVELDQKQPGHRDGRRKATLTETSRYLRKHWAPLHDRPVNGISRKEIATRLTEIESENGPSARNHARAALHRFYNWAIGESFDIDANPVTGTNRASEGDTAGRDLTNREVTDIWNACGPDAFGRIVRLLILTGQRRTEVGDMQRTEIGSQLEIGAKWWDLAASRTKNKRAHDVPLSDAALDLIGEGADGFLFGRGERGFAGWDKAKKALDRRIAAARAERGETGDAKAWRLHDIRHTVKTGLENLKVRDEVSEAILNHRSGKKSGMSGRYNHATYPEERRDALRLWAQHVASVVAGGKGLAPPMRAVA